MHISSLIMLLHCLSFSLFELDSSYSYHPPLTSINLTLQGRRNDKKAINANVYTLFSGV